MQKDVVIIKFAVTAALDKSMLQTANPSLSKLFQKHGVTSYESAYPIPESALIPESQDLQRIYYLYYQSGENPRQVAAKLSRHRDIEYAVPKYYHRINDAPSISQTQIDDLLSTIPNDSLFSQMTHLNLIRAPEAWDVVKGDTGGVVIAIVDGGTDWHHEDLFDNIWTNPGEIPDNGHDDDGNGFVDDIHGWNFADGGNDPTGLTATPLNAAHGTAVAGVASAVTNNLIGISGVSWNALVMPVNSSCAADSFICYGYDGMIYAALTGADIINASWGSAYEQLTAFEERELLHLMDDIISFVTANGAVVVSSAGNDIANVDEILSLPGGDPHVLAVGATMKESDQLAWFSNYGVSVDVFAPGSVIESTIPENDYTAWSGTSFSSPLVAGVAALVKTRFPHFSPDQLAAQVRITADAIDYANPDLAGQLGRGRINTYDAVTITSSPAVRIVDASFWESGQDGIIEGGDTVIVTVNLTNHLETVTNLSLELENDDPDVQILQNDATILSLPTGDTTGVDFQFVLHPSVYEERTLRFIVAMNNGSYSDQDLLRVYANEPIVMTHDTGILQVSITSEGNIGWTGFAGSSLGDGFIYNGTNLLFEAGLLVGVSSNQISDCVRGVDEFLEQDFRLQEGSDVLLASGEVAAEEGKVTLVDSRADLPLGVVIQQRSYADNQTGHDDFIILSYTISSTSNQALSDLYIGLFFDWDLPADAQDDARFDDEMSMGYVQNNSTSPTVLAATYLLASQEDLVYSAIDNEAEIYGGGGEDDGFTPDEKWRFLSEGTEDQSLYGKDVSTLTATGPFYLPPGESMRVAFAVIAAGSVQDLLSNVDNAQRYWDNSILPYELLEGVTTYYLSQNFSNPFNPVKESTTILYSLVKPSDDVRLAVFDLLGREVKELYSGSSEDGEHAIRWNGKDNLGKLVSSGIYIYRLEVDGQTHSRKLVVLK
jgi:subtilisin family serine protease